jgi:hypothetical protein
MQILLTLFCLTSTHFDGKASLFVHLMQILLTLFFCLTSTHFDGKASLFVHLMQESQETVISISTHKKLQWLISLIFWMNFRTLECETHFGSLHNWMKKSQNMPVWLRKKLIVLTLSIIAHIALTVKRRPYNSLHLQKRV